MSRTHRPTATLLAVACAVVALAGSPARADERGDALLKKVDEAVNAAEDQTFVYEVVTKEKGKDPRTLKLKVWVKDGKRLTEFLAPGDVKGTKALTYSMSQIYVYLPAFQKVRRVTSHASKQNFMGTAFSQAEQALSWYAKYYSAEIVSEDDESWTLEAEATDDDAPYETLKLVISKEHTRPLKIVYYDDGGHAVKTETRSDYTCRDGGGVEVCNMEELQMVDHRAEDLTTVFHRKEWSINDGLSDRLFSVRSLQRMR
ncbi:MAG: outer membrane lipoprotein-sorting protein [Myxococcota bacterium]